MASEERSRRPRGGAKVEEAARPASAAGGAQAPSSGAPRVLEVEAERLPPRATAAEVIGQRIVDAFAPIVCAVVIDGVDFVTFGRLGIILGFPLGSISGWVLTGSLGYSTRWRVALSAAAGVYCMVPGTGFLPLATVAAVVAKLFGVGPRRELRR